MNRRLASIAGGAGIALFVFYLAFVNYTRSYELGIAWNFVTGELYAQEAPGVHVSPPWVLVSRIDTRPTRLCITSAGRGYNCKLVRFAPEHWREFVAVQGWSYWWWSNRVSINWGHEETYRGMSDLMRGYAWSAEPYSFVEEVK